MNWPTPEELEAQQSPFDPTGTYPYEYKIVIVEQIAENLFEEQLRTYTIEEKLDEESLKVPANYQKQMGRRFRFAQEGETADIHVMNQETSEPIGLVVAGE